jgi:hypothetical protein
MRGDRLGIVRRQGHEMLRAWIQAFRGHHDVGDDA